MSDTGDLIDARMQLHQLTAEHGHSHDDIWAAIAGIREEMTSARAQLEEAHAIAEEAVEAIEEAQEAVERAEAEPENAEAQVEAAIAVEDAAVVSDVASEAVADVAPNPDAWLFKRIGAREIA